MIPWFLLQLSARDMVGEMLRLANYHHTTGTGGAASAGKSWTVPPDKVLVITVWAARMIADVALNPFAASLDVQGEHGVVVAHHEVTGVSRTNAAGLAELGIVQPDYIIVPAGSIVNLLGIFNGAGNHTVQVSLQGILIPKGQLSLY